MRKIEVTSSGYGDSVTKKEVSSTHSKRVDQFAIRLYNTLEESSVLGSNHRTNTAIAACIMYDDEVNNNSTLMESMSFRSDMSLIILSISAVNETTGLIQQMNESGNMFDSVNLFSSAFLGEIYPENTLARKMCYVEKVYEANKN